MGDKSEEKYKELGLLAIALGITKEELRESADKLNLENRNVEQIMDMVSDQISINRLKAKIDTCRKVVGKMHFVIIIICVVGINLL